MTKESALSTNLSVVSVGIIRASDCIILVYRFKYNIIPQPFKLYTTIMNYRTPLNKQINPIY